jgi:hypothetical protein
MVDMVEQVIARQALAAQQALRPFLEAVMQSPLLGGRPAVADFWAGNPQEPTLPGFVEALQPSPPRSPLRSSLLRAAALTALARVCSPRGAN